MQHVTIQPREKQKMGHTSLKVSEQRTLNNLFTRTYMEEQLMVALAGRAAEELVSVQETLNPRP